MRMRASEPGISQPNPPNLQALRTPGGGGRNIRESEELSVIYLPTGIFLLLPCIAIH